MTTNGHQNGRPRVLVIDDEESMRHALARGLERAGFHCETAATGRGGVEMFVGGGFDAVLTDVRLPDLSGLDIAAILTEMDASIPVVVMTGYGTMEVALEAMRRGAKDYVQKPFSIEDVSRILMRAIQERLLTRENRRLRALVERRLSPEGYQDVEAELAALRGPNGAGATPGVGAVPGVGAAPGVGARGRLPASNGAFGRPGGEASAGHDGRPVAPRNGTAGNGQPLPLREAQRTFEVSYVEQLLARTGGNVAAASRLAGISRPNFHKKLKTLGVDAHRFKQAARRGRMRDL